MRSTAAPVFLVSLVLLSLASGCGVSPAAQNPCAISFPLVVTPLSATADHMAAPPGNQAQFTGTARATAAPGCPVPALAMREYATWTNPDPTDITISSATDSANGTATCKSATSGPVTLTGLFSPQVVSGPAPATTEASVTLTCK